MGLENWTYAPTVAADDLGDYDYLEYKESGKESYSPGNSTANRVFIVRWDRRLRFLDDCLGWSFLGASNRINRIIPEEHPEISNFWAVDAQVDGIGVLGQNEAGDHISWTNAKITVNYKPLTYHILADNDVDTELERYVTRQFTFASNFLQLQGQMKFVSNKRIVQFPPTITTGDMALQYVWHEVPAMFDNPFTPPIMSAFDVCIGRINSTTFDAENFNAPPGTILFTGADPKMITPKLTEDTFYWEITFNFVYRNNGTALDGGIAGHNYLYNPFSGVGGWDLVTTDGTAGGKKIYKEADLNTLFTVG